MLGTPTFQCEHQIGALLPHLVAELLRGETEVLGAAGRPAENRPDLQHDRAIELTARLDGEFVQLQLGSNQKPESRPTDEKYEYENRNGLS